MTTIAARTSPFYITASSGSYVVTGNISASTAGATSVAGSTSGYKDAINIFSGNNIVSISSGVTLLTQSVRGKRRPRRR